MKKLRKAGPVRRRHAKQLREGVELAVRLAELIQNAGRPGAQLSDRVLTLPFLPGRV